MRQTGDTEARTRTAADTECTRTPAADTAPSKGVQMLPMTRSTIIRIATLVGLIRGWR